MKSKEDLEMMHRLEQEEAKKEIEKMKYTTIKLHPAGGFDKESGLVYEPIGKMVYIFKFKNYKGLAEAKRIARVECPNCGSSIISIIQKKDSVIKCVCGYLNKNPPINYELFTDFNNLKLVFEGKPLQKVIFNVPSSEPIKYWLNNYLIDKNRKEIDGKYVFEALKKFYQAFYDLPLQRSYSILATATIQSWLIEILDILYYISISGETGSGKTALLEALANVCRHGLLAANIRSAGIARCAEKYKLSLCIDEIDSKKFRDDDIEGICRQGYRRGQFYVRMMPKSHEPEFFNVFGFKCYSYRGEVADDLQSRSIDTPISKTKSKEVPIINLYKQNFSPFELLFFWYMDNVKGLYSKTSQFQYTINSLNKYNNININDIYGNNSNLIKNNVDRNVIALQTPYLGNFVNIVKEKPIFGRNIEIGYLLYSLMQILSLDIDSVLMETIEEKQEIEEASQEEGWEGILRELFVLGYKDAVLKDDIKIIPYRIIIGRYLRRMREIYDNVPSQQQIRRLLRQIGFIDNINRKVMWVEDKAKLCFIYDSKIKEGLGIKDKQKELPKEPRQPGFEPAIEQEKLADEEHDDLEDQG